MAASAKSKAARRILIPVDGSRHSTRAISWYKENLRHDNDVVILFYATEGLSLPSVTLKSPIQVPVDEWQTIVEAHQEKMAEVEKGSNAECARLGITATFQSDTCNRPGEAIVDAVNRLNIDMIVMGSRGLSTFRRTFLGSVSDFVLHHAGKPISIIPANNN